MDLRVVLNGWEENRKQAGKTPGPFFFPHVLAAARTHGQRVWSTCSEASSRGGEEKEEEDGGGDDDHDVWRIGVLYYAFVTHSSVGIQGHAREGELKRRAVQDRIRPLCGLASEMDRVVWLLG